MRAVVSITIVASFLSFAAAAQTSAPPPKQTEEPQVTHISFEGSSLDISWTREQRVSEKTLELSPKVAWSAYPATFGELGMDPNIIDSDQMIFGSVGSHRHTIAKKRLSHFFDCGEMLGVSTADSYEIWVRVISQILPIDGHLSTLRTQVEATARAGDRPGETVRCSSTGLLESQIAKLLVQEGAKLEK